MLFDQEGIMRIRIHPAWWLVIALASMAGCRDAHGQSTGAFTGTQIIAVSATAAYGTKYPARSFAPKLEVSVSAGQGDQRTVVVRDTQYAKPYQCTLTGSVVKGKLTFDPGQSCEIQAETPDFCLLKEERCKAREMNLKCALEKGNLGVLTGKLTSGTINQLPAGAWGMDLKLSVVGCVLVNGYNKNAPIMVHGGLLTVKAP